ncbi:hypothetical protein GL267_003075 [Acidithiobacillus ferrianus]|uniref:Uncharacterized protein n=2 Tax=Acidithiobacillus ferrianus TaxID=2678518 RepID=A0A845UHL9_9PROT|nr:hypothetical protein [Acidithiobacillus ferrianus]NDU43344.1 hypothetical protein [Acidithiobacillus ferrianus]
MSTRKLTYEIACDIQSGKMTREDAVAGFGHIIDSETLDEVLASLDCVRHEEDADGEDIIVIRDDSWERTWSEEDPA